MSEVAVSQKYLKLYRDNIGKISKTSSPYINSFRDKAFEKFNELGIPSKKNEMYRYANLNLFFEREYSGYFLPAADDFRKAENFKCDVANLDAYVLTLINGFYPAEIKRLPDGIWIGNLNEAALKFPELIEKHYGKYAQSDVDGLVHLNTAMASDGVFIYVPDGVKINKPVQVVNLVDAAEDTFNQHRNLIIVGNEAEFSLIVCDHTLSPNKFLTNSVSEIYVGENARFDILRVQNEHKAS
jgi:Fe-S cluster assembly protein SufD